MKSQRIWGNGPMSVRQQDIAAHLGLSVSTVSLALRDAAQVAAETRVRVRDAATQLGYNYRPRQLMRTEVAQMAFITRIDPNNVFYGAVLTGAERECRSLNIALHYTRLDNPDSRMTSHFSDADALLVVGTIRASETATAQATGLLNMPTLQQPMRSAPFRQLPSFELPPQGTGIR